MLPGTVAPTAAIEHSTGQTVSLSHLIGVMRRRWRIIFTMTAIGAAVGAFLASRQPPTYQAQALIRLAGERRSSLAIWKPLSQSWVEAPTRCSLWSS